MIEKAKKNLLAKIQNLPLDLQEDVKILIDGLNRFQSAFNEILIEVKTNSTLKGIENLPQEIWKDIVNFESLYQVSNYGRIKSFIHRKIKILKPYCREGSYPQVNLCKKNYRKKTFVHVLVAQAFVPNPENKPMVNHKDGNKLNSRA